MPALVLGPILRHVGSGDATVWVETDAPCEVEVLDHRARTFAVEGRHYAIVVVDGLEPAREYPYEVRLDGEPAWPEHASVFPPSSIRTIDPERPLRLVFGSCRTAGPHHPPFTCRRASDSRGLGIDALRALAIRAARSGSSGWPDALLMLGDQIYADQPSIRIVDFTRSHQPDPDAPRNQLEDFTEYCVAYCDAWSEPAIRWLLSTVPSSMIFDDHEIHDEWKISQAWVDEMRAHEWYDRRVVGGLMSYWLYQHLGNLSPAELEDNDLLRRIRAAGDGGDILREVARDADRHAGHSRFSFCRDFGRVRLVVIDARAGRDLEPGRRRIVNDAEWRWVEERMHGDFDHLLLASSIPVVLGHGMHWLEAWSEAVCDGAWGTTAARTGERLRQRANLGHWAAFQHSFRRFAELLERVASGALGGPPRSVVLLSGDVHHCYLAEVGFRRGSAARAPVWQAVCSGLRKQIEPSEKTAMRLAQTRVAHALGRGLARAAGVPDPPVRWRFVEEPLYANQVATLEAGRRDALLRVETTMRSGWRDPRLETAFEHRLCGRRDQPSPS